MLTQQLELTNEQTSPLFRIMWIHNMNEPNRRHYDNNICAFHIGNGLILSVAHNLRTEAQLFKSIDESIFSTAILPFLNQEQILLFNQWYPFDPGTNKRYINIPDQKDIPKVVEILKQINFDTRWLTLMQKNICKPYLIVQFKNNQFYNDANLTSCFNPSTCFHEPGLNRYTFLLELELVEPFYNEDIALYRIINAPPEIIQRMPSLEVDCSILSDTQTDYYCLQSSPNSEVGKLLNKAQIEGYLEHFNIFNDRFGGNYTFEGTRYMIKGYFRFGSSGAPYVFFDRGTSSFKVNAIQSEACPLQLTIDNKKEGNFQYINAIATPLNIIGDRLRGYME